MDWNDPWTGGLIVGVVGSIIASILIGVSASVYGRTKTLTALAFGRVRRALARLIYRETRRALLARQQGTLGAVVASFGIETLIALVLQAWLVITASMMLIATYFAASSALGTEELFRQMVLRWTERPVMSIVSGLVGFIVGLLTTVVPLASYLRFRIASDVAQRVHRSRRRLLKLTAKRRSRTPV
jgi:hypothetical protein